MFENIKMINTVETDVAIGTEDFSLYPTAKYKVGNTVEYGLQAYRILHVEVSLTDITYHLATRTSVLKVKEVHL